MKSIKYIVGLGVVGGIIVWAILSVFKVTDLISGEQFADYMSQLLSIIGIVMVSAVIISLVVNIFGRTQK